MDLHSYYSLSVNRTSITNHICGAIPSLTFLYCLPCNTYNRLTGIHQIEVQYNRDISVCMYHGHSRRFYDCNRLVVLGKNCY